MRTLVNLAQNCDFDTRVYRVLADTQFSPWTYLVNNVQFDSVSAKHRLAVPASLDSLTPGNDVYARLHPELARRRGAGSLRHARATGRGEIRLRRYRY